MSGKKTPRYLIQEYAENVETEKSVHPTRRRRPLSKSPEGASISQQPTVSSTTQETTRSATKRRRTGRDEEFTPRHLIQGLIDTQDTTKPSTRKRKRVGELLPPSSSKVKKSRRRSSLGVPTLEKMVSQFTPRSMITGFLEQGVEETPEQRAAKGDKSSSRSSFGDLPNNEITFHPVEASFHETKLEKQSKKAKGDRSRAAIHIVKRRSEKLARAAGEEIDFSNEDESDDSNEHCEGAEQGRHHDLSSRQSTHVSHHDADDTSAKDTSSVDPSPRKSFSRRRATPSKRESIASVKNASHLTPDKSLQVSVPSPGQLSPRETTPTKGDAPSSKGETSGKKTSECTGGSQSGSVTSKSHSVSSLQENVTEADTIEPDEANDKTDVEMSHGAVDESVKSSANMSELKSRVGEIADGSDLQPSPRNKSRSRVYEHTPSQMEERIQRSSRNMSNSKLEEESVGPGSRNETGLSTPGRGSKSKSHLEMSASRSRSRSRSKSRSRLFDITDEVDGKGGNNNETDDDDHHSSLEVSPEEFDEPRSGRSSPRYSTGLTKNVYDFHDDSPSKRIIGKLAKTLQKSTNIGENIADPDEEEEEDDPMEGETHYDNMSESDEDVDHYGDEPEESIIPNTDREVRAYYTPLRTPHLKEKSSSRPVSMVTSTPKPPSEVDKHQGPRPKGRPKMSEKKKDTGYMPTSVVKGLFTHFCPSKVAKETIAEVEKASAQFWENAAKDLESYALHAHRKTIEESDVELLMKRQKFITPKESLPALVEKYLPLELRQEIIPICRSGNKLELK